MELSRHRTRVSAKGQVVIPKPLRDRMRIERGVEVTLTPLDDNRLLLERVPRLSELFGMMGKAKATELLLRERRKESKVEVHRLRELMKRR